MKLWKKKFLPLHIVLVLVISSCGNDEEPFIDITENKGVYVRVIDANTGTFDRYDLDRSIFNINLEVVDEMGGDLFSAVEMYVVYYKDGNLEDDQSTTKLLSYIPSSLFIRNQNSGLPRFYYNITTLDLLAELELEAADINPGDIFRFFWSVHLNTGQTFDVNNTAPSIAGQPYYQSPFFYDAVVECDVVEGYGIGEYEMTIPVGNGCLFFGCLYLIKPEDVSLEVGDKPTQRVFDIEYLSFVFPLVIDFECGDITVPDQSTGLSCSGEDIRMISSDFDDRYDPYDDSTLEFSFVMDHSDGCGLGNYFEIVLMRR